MAGFAQSSARTCSAVVAGYTGAGTASVTATTDSPTDPSTPVAVRRISVVPWGMYMVNDPPGSMATGAPFAVRLAAPSVSPRSVLTNPGTEGAIAAGTITRGPVGALGVAAKPASMPFDRTVR